MADKLITKDKRGVGKNKQLKGILGPEGLSSFKAMVGESTPDMNLVRGKIVDLALSLKDLQETLASITLVFPRMVEEIRAFRLKVLVFNKGILCVNSITDKLLSFKGLFEHVGSTDQKKLLEAYKKFKSSDQEIIRHIITTTNTLKNKLGGSLVLDDSVIIEGPCPWFSFAATDLKNDLLMFTPEQKKMVSMLFKQLVLIGQSVHNVVFTPDITKEEFRDLIMLLITNLKAIFTGKYNRGFELLEKQSQHLVNNIEDYYSSMMASSRDEERDVNIIIREFMSDVLTSNSGKKDPIAEAQLRGLMTEVERLIGKDSAILSESRAE